MGGVRARSRIRRLEVVGVHGVPGIGEGVGVCLAGGWGDVNTCARGALFVGEGVGTRGAFGRRTFNSDDGSSIGELVLSEVRWNAPVLLLDGTGVGLLAQREAQERQERRLTLASGEGFARKYPAHDSLPE